ncbi:cyclophilin-like domain-containing protein [Thelephora terrestris]|uniref:peptidylprolyl isomerase n=1 Tax=Thelephora terrestris TaxID=56493 RepID=A0A9P6HNE3_9AGAM|nr:cyclophilin-like domain-containing protein [Thelephora terrestris]
MVGKRTFFDISIDNTPAGRLIFELFDDKVPRTCENFRALCTGEKGISPLSDRPLYYKGSILHRSIKDFMIQGGDFTKRNGMGGESIYGSPFADEDMSHELDSHGLLCMANKGPNTNGSQFFITLRPCPHLNGKHVVFGRVIRGYEDVIPKIVDVPTDEKDRPRVPIVVSNCGELELRKKPVAPQPEEAVPSRDVTRREDDLPQRSRSRHKHKKRRHDVNSNRDSRSRSRSLSRSSSSPRPPGARGDPASDSEGFRRQHGGSSRKRHKTDRAPSSRKLEHHHGNRSRSPVKAHDDGVRDPGVEERKETEEEYDARLEREENERIAAKERKRLEALKDRYQQDLEKPPQNGVRFKGRGRMKFIDPELQRR